MGIYKRTLPHLTAFIGTNKIVMSVCIPVWRLMVFLPNFVGILVWCFDRSVCLTIRGFKVPTVYLSSKLSVCIRVSYDQSKGCSAGLFYDYLAAVCLSVCICESTIISLKIVLLVFEWLSALLIWISLHSSLCPHQSLPWLLLSGCNCTIESFLFVHPKSKPLA